MTVNTTWAVLSMHVADVLHYDVDELRLGYFLLPGGASAKVPSKALPKVLDDYETTEDLLTEIREYVKEQNVKNKGKGPSSRYVTKVVVRLVDLRKSSDGDTSKVHLRITQRKKC